MERGLYAAASGMIAQQTIQDVLASNIANASTVGYKQDNPTFRAVQGMALNRLANGNGSGPKVGEVGMGVAPDQVAIDWQPGAMVHTGNPLDAALDAGQFFAVRTPGGEGYTRAGNFQRDAAGHLLTASGFQVLDTTGNPIQLQGSGAWSLNKTGDLMSNGKPIARLKIVQAAPNSLQRQGDSLFTATSPKAIRSVARPNILPATLEQSNVNTVRSLVQMITVTRGFDMSQKALLTQDDLLKHAANELGRV